MLTQIPIVRPVPVVDVPEDVPTEAWTVKQIDAWAVAHGVDLAGAKTKAAKIGLINL